MSRHPILVGFALAVGFLLLFPVLIMLFIPGDKIESSIGKALEREGYVFRSDGVRKTFPFGIKIANISISDERGPLLKIDEVSATLELLPLLAGKIVLGCRARIGKGGVEAQIRPGTGDLTFHLADLGLEDVPLLKTVTSADLRGALTVDGSFAGTGRTARGEVRMEVRHAEFRGIRIGDVPLPDASYQTIRCMYRSTGGNGTLESLAFQGEGIYIRLRGRITAARPMSASPLELSLELMPKPDFIERQKFVFLALAPYQTSPGSYRIPVRGTLGKPVIR